MNRIGLISLMNIKLFIRRYIFISHSLIPQMEPIHGRLIFIIVPHYIAYDLPFISIQDILALIMLKEKVASFLL